MYATPKPPSPEDVEASGEDDRRPSCSETASVFSDRKDSIVSDSKFDLILASLQSLAFEIERDFRSDCENPEASVARTKSENNLSENCLSENAFSSSTAKLVKE
jgi:hypothetical protein